LRVRLEGEGERRREGREGVILRSREGGKEVRIDGRGRRNLQIV
jgi:hypothetical protein